jgi:hypothetical protein
VADLTTAEQKSEASASAPKAAPKSDWPKTPGGTVDWEAVFEDPETGLLAQFQRVVTPQAMRDSAIQTIKLLFARKGDEAEAERLTNELTEIINDDLTSERIELVRYAIVATFRQIKEFRQKKAAEFKLLKASKAKDAERRAAEQSQQSIKKTLAEKRKRKMRMAMAAGILVVASVATAAYFYLRDPNYPPRADQILLQQMKTAAAGGSGRVHVYGGSLQTRRYFADISVIAENVPTDACASVASNLVKSGIFTVNGDLLNYASMDAARTICEKAKAPIRITWVPAQ